MPSLRNVARRGPYMDAGEFATFARGPGALLCRARAAGGHSELKPLHLSETELRQLEAFLRSLSATRHTTRAARPPANDHRRSRSRGPDAELTDAGPSLPLPLPWVRACRTPWDYPSAPRKRAPANGSPPAAPVVPNLGRGLQHHEAPSLAGQMPGHDQARRTAPDHIEQAIVRCLGPSCSRMGRGMPVVGQWAVACS